MELDIWNHIIISCDSGKLFKSIQLLSKDHLKLTKRYPEIKNKLTNHLWTLIMLYPNNDWDWASISSNPNITWENIQTHSDKHRNWYGISRNPNITWEIIQTHPDKPWIWYAISYNEFNKHPI